MLQTDSEQNDANHPGQSFIKVDFQLNNKPVSVEAHPLSRLLDVIREKLCLTGTKEGCGEGECGACSVIMDGELVDSCLVPAAQVHGTRVLTIEGVANSRSYDRIIETFVKSGGIQCGICTPGMIMAIVNLIERTKTPSDLSEDQIRNALAGNLCRCTGYSKIVESVLRLVRESDKNES
jgi:aerobic carbon-monoxide dehydrogenase small subunit